MSDRLVIIDGYNLIHRTPTLRPGAGRTLAESRDKLLNLLAWAYGTAGARFIVVFDGAEQGGRDQPSARVDVRFSKPPQTADDLIRILVEERLRYSEQVTVVTADLEVARHARAMGADIALSDLFLTSALGPNAPKQESDDKPTVNMSRQELEEWAKVFRSRPKDEETEH